MAKQNNNGNAPMIREAARKLAAIYENLSDFRMLPLDRWALPEEATHKIHLATDTTEVWKGLHSSFRLERYRDAYNTVIPEVEKAAQAWAREALGKERDTLDKLKEQLQTPEVDKRLNEVARRIAKRAQIQELDTRKYARQATIKRYGAHSDVEETEKFEKRVKEQEKLARQLVAAAVRMELAESLQDKPELDPREHRATENRKEEAELLAIIFSHPKGLDALQAYYQSPEKGTKFSVGLVMEAINAVLKFSQELNDNPEHICRYPVLVVGGVTRLGLQNIKGFLHYIVEISRILSINPYERLLINLGLVLLCLSLVSTGGAAAPLIAPVIALLDFALLGTGTVLAYMREHEQELGYEASALRSKDKQFATSTGYIDTYLSGAAALLTAITVLRNLKEIRNILGYSSRNLNEVPRLKKITQAKPNYRGVDARGTETKNTARVVTSPRESTASPLQQHPSVTEKTVTPTLEAKGTQNPAIANKTGTAPKEGAQTRAILGDRPALERDQLTRGRTRDPKADSIPETVEKRGTSPDQRATTAKSRLKGSDAGRKLEERYIAILKEKYPKLKNLDLQPRARPSAGRSDGAPEFAFEERMQTTQGEFSLVVYDKGIYDKQKVAVMEFDGISVDGWIEEIKIEQRFENLEDIIAGLRQRADFAEAYGLKGVRYSIASPDPSLAKNLEEAIAQQRLRNVVSANK